MTNTQVRLIAAAIALVGGGVLANVERGAGFSMILVASVLFIVEYIKCQKE